MDGEGRQPRDFDDGIDEKLRTPVLYRQREV